MTIASERKAIVTGGAAGFGLETARSLSSAGVHVAVVDVSRSGLEALPSAVGKDVLAIEADIRIPDQTRAAVEQVVSTFGGLDTVVNSAGVIDPKPLEEVSEADWDFTLDVNLKGTFLMSQAAAPHLRESGRGRIVSVASDAGKRGSPWIQAYTASKFGVVGLTESLAAELAPAKVTVNCVCPVGCPTTGMGSMLVEWKRTVGSKTSEEVIADAASTNPLGRNATEADVASAIMYFISEEASFLTGVALDVDGGAHLGIMPGLQDR